MGERSNYIANLEAELAKRQADEKVVRNWKIAAVGFGLTTCGLISALVGVVI